MTKQLTPLEALNKLISRHPFNYEEYKIIETALKRLAYLDKLAYLTDDDTSEIEKKLKALEIIREKRLNAEWLMESNTYKEYLEYAEDDYEENVVKGATADKEEWFRKWVATQEEYDLLKEVLL